MTNRFILNAQAEGNNKWWAYLLTFLLLTIGYAIGQIPLGVVIVLAVASGKINYHDIESNDTAKMLNPEVLGVDNNIFLLLLILTFVFCLLGLLIGYKYIQQKNIKSLITAFEKIRWSRFFFALLLWSAFLSIITLIGYFTSPESFTWNFQPGKFIILFIISILTIPIQTSTEEFIFRGFLLQGFALLFKSALPALLITSLTFGLLHMANPEVQEYGWLTMLPYYSMFGMFLGILTLLDEGMELPMGIHAGNNITSAILVTSDNTVLQTDSLFKTQGANPSSEFLIWIGTALLFFGICWYKYKWKNVKLLY